jgi:hypothetical protein
VRIRLLSGAVLLFASGCGSAIDLGTDVIWSADQESGDLSAWAADAKGGWYVLAPDTGSSVEPSSDHAHDGRYSVRIASAGSAAGEDQGGGLYREAPYPEEAYYSVWYYLPVFHTTITSWALFKFRTRSGSDLAELLDILLKSLPGGTMTLVVRDHRPQYLESPLSDPPAVVPIGRWFQIEAFYRNADDDSGRLTVWLDGRPVYDLSRPTGSGPDVYFTPCSITGELEPEDAELFVDDAAVSYTRIGPTGVLRVANR